jgi:hypothetical protein
LGFTREFEFVVNPRFCGIFMNSCTNMYTKDLIWHPRTVYNSQIGDKRHAN